MFIYKIDNAISHHIMPSICMSPDNDQLMFIIRERVTTYGIP